VRLVIFEPHAAGHHAIYLQWLAPAARRKNCSVVIATTKAASEHRAIEGLRAEIDDLEIHLIDEPIFEQRDNFHALRLFARDLSYWILLRKAIRDIRARMPVDAILLPYAEYCFLSLAILGPPFAGVPWSAISMRLSFLQPGPAERPAIPTKWRFARRVLRSDSLNALFVINPSVTEVPQAWLPTRSRARLRYLPDPAANEVAACRPSSRSAMELAESAIVVLVYGWLDERKGADALLRAITSDKRLDNYVVLLAGEQSTAMRAQMEAFPLYGELRKAKRLIVLDRFLTDSEQSAVFAASDIVWLGYRNHLYMSGVLVLAGRAGLPVIGSQGGEVGRMIEAHGLGVNTAIEQPADIVGALLEMREYSTRRSMGERGRRSFANHTVENFGDSVMRAFDLPRPRDGITGQALVPERG
jgi:glycosyltransferase involved in cell wall biosynthesis